MKLKIVTVAAIVAVMLSTGCTKKAGPADEEEQSSDVDFGELCDASCTQLQDCHIQTFNDLYDNMDECMEECVEGFVDAQEFDPCFEERIEYGECQVILNCADLINVDTFCGDEFDAQQSCINGDRN